MAQGLNVNDVINVQVNVGPTAVANRNFGVALLAGPSAVIDVFERYRYYSDLDSVAADFGTSAVEYRAASTWFAQIPKPPLVIIGRWAQTATAAILHGGALTLAQRAMSNFSSITTGGFSITVGGVVKSITGVNLTATTSLSQVAAAVSAAMTTATAGICRWTGTRFEFEAPTTGVASTLTYATAPGTGTDLSILMQMTAATAQYAPVQGIAAETPLAAAQLFANQSNDWYALVFCPSNGLTYTTDTDMLNVAAFIEGASPARIFGFSTGASAEVAPNNTSSLCYQLRALNYSRTFVTWSTTSSYSIVGFFGRGLTVDFTGSRTALTMKFKTIVGMIAETIGTSAARALGALGVNVFVNYNNGSAIIQEGTAVNGRFFDEVHGLDWLQNYVQTGQFNILYQSLTKVPQTDEGMTTLMTQLEADLAVGVRCGLIAPGVWNADGFGQLLRGQTLPKGYYVYAAPIATQSQADREARKAPTMQAAIKMAGAVHSENIIINVNR